MAARTADGVGARGSRNGWEKKPLEISELGCADGCGWRGCNGERKSLGMSELGCAGGRGRLRTAWVQRSVIGNGWGEEAAGDERAWLRGRLRMAWVQGSGCSGEEALGMSELGCADGCGRRGAREWLEMVWE